MYPWKQALNSWSESANFKIDALGLITILGAEEINTSVGRLTPSRYAEFLPLVGAFVLANNRFTQKQPNFTLYNLTDGFVTTEVAGWFSRWLKVQNFHHVHHIVTWSAREESHSQIATHFLPALAIALPFHAILIALAVLSGDWWGFANSMAMAISVIVRIVLTEQNRAGIDAAIASTTENMQERNTQEPRTAKLLVLTDDSKMVTVYAPRELVRDVFVMNPEVPLPRLYISARWLGWATFSAHIISIGMASLPVQIYTVVFVALPTILTVFKVGCDDRNMLDRIVRSEGQVQGGAACQISSRLRAVCSEHPRNESRKTSGPDTNKSTQAPKTKTTEYSGLNNPDLEAQKQIDEEERRQDVFVWIDLSDEELGHLKAWNLVPRETNSRWWQEFEEKRERFRGGKVPEGGIKGHCLERTPQSGSNHNPDEVMPATLPHIALELTP